MKRVYKKPSLFNTSQLGTIAFVALMIFLAYTMLTPRSTTMEEAESPDGKRNARLSRYYYFEGQPSYKIDYRDSGKKAWTRLYHLMAYTNIPPESAEPSIEWTDNSRRLDFLMNGTSIWHHVFEQQ